MAAYPSFTARPLKPTEVAAALALARDVGIHGVYVANVLHTRARPGSRPRILAFHGAARLLGLAYFGPRGNLLVLQRGPRILDPESAAQAILDAQIPWRIVLAPHELVGALVRLGRLATLVDREQIYYGVAEDELIIPAAGEHDGVNASTIRLAEKRDLESLMEAALHLNQSDLRVDPWCVDRDWLRRSTRDRIRKHTTFVIGPVGTPLAKLDLGSVGPAGVVIEGVYTWPDRRGRGLASNLVAMVARDRLTDHPRVCLHVAAGNVPARRAYAKCGMTPAGVCQLMLRG